MIDLNKLIRQIYDEVEAKNAEQAVMLCLRLAGQIKDSLNWLVFMRILHREWKVGLQHIFNDFSNLTKDEQSLAYKKSKDIWIDLHKMSVVIGNDSTNNDDEKKALNVSVQEIPDEIKLCEQAVCDLNVPPGMDPYDIANFVHTFTQEKAIIRLRIKALIEIKSNILAFCFSYASSIENQLLAQKKTANFIDKTYQVVNNFFTINEKNLVAQLMTAAELLNSNNSEDFSLALTEVRRAIKSAADFFFPPMKNKVICADGNERSLGEDNYLNRLHEYILKTFSKSTSRELLEAEFENLAAFIRRIDSLASKGVHANVTKEEAIQGLVGLYFFLYNIIIKKWRVNDE